MRRMLAGLTLGVGAVLIGLGALPADATGGGTTTTHATYPTTTKVTYPTTTATIPTTQFTVPTTLGTTTTVCIGEDAQGRPCVTTTTASTTTTTVGTTTTTPPTVSLFAVGTFAFCGPDGLPLISITFGNRPDLNGQTGTLFFSDFTSVPLTFQSNTTVTIPYPASRTTPLGMLYILSGEFATAFVTLPPNCPPPTTTTTASTTSTTIGTTTTTVTSTVTSTPTIPTTVTVPPTVCPLCLNTVPPSVATTLASTTTAATVPTTAPTPTTAGTAPTTAPKAATTAPAVTTVPPQGDLPVTGTYTWPLTATGLTLMAGGGAALFFTRRPKVA
jgi:hypothetical protein